MPTSTNGPIASSINSRIAVDEIRDVVAQHLRAQLVRVDAAHRAGVALEVDDVDDLDRRCPPLLCEIRIGIAQIARNRVRELPHRVERIVERVHPRT